MAARFDVIAFDFDGVLVESVDVKTRAFETLYRDYGEEVTARVVNYHLEHGGVSRYDKFRYFHREFLGRDLPPQEEHQLGELFSRLVEDNVVSSPMVPGAELFLEKYGSSMPIYVVSGTPHDELLRIIDRRGLNRFFKGVFGSPRKKGQILHDIIATSGVDSLRVLMVGDAVTDYEGAEQAGTSFLGRVPRGHANPFPKGVHVIQDLFALPSAI